MFNKQGKLYLIEMVPRNVGNMIPIYDYMIIHY